MSQKNEKNSGKYLVSPTGFNNNCLLHCVVQKTDKFVSPLFAKQFLMIYGLPGQGSDQKNMDKVHEIKETLQTEDPIGYEMIMGVVLRKVMAMSITAENSFAHFIDAVEFYLENGKDSDGITQFNNFILPNEQEFEKLAEAFKQFKKTYNGEQADAYNDFLVSIPKGSNDSILQKIENYWQEKGCNNYKTQLAGSNNELSINDVLPYCQQQEIDLQVGSENNLQDEQSDDAIHLTIKNDHWHYQVQDLQTQTELTAQYQAAKTSRDNYDSLTDSARDNLLDSHHVLASSSRVSAFYLLKQVVQKTANIISDSASFSFLSQLFNKLENPEKQVKREQSPQLQLSLSQEQSDYQLALRLQQEEYAAIESDLQVTTLGDRQEQIAADEAYARKLQQQFDPPFSQPLSSCSLESLQSDRKLAERLQEEENQRVGLLIKH